jgi:transaldolase
MRLPYHRAESLGTVVQQQESCGPKLRVDNVQELDIEKRTYLDDEALFRFEFNEDPMAV